MYNHILHDTVKPHIFLKYLLFYLVGIINWFVDELSALDNNLVTHDRTQKNTLLTTTNNLFICSERIICIVGNKNITFKQNAFTFLVKDSLNNNLKVLKLQQFLVCFNK